MRRQEAALVGSRVPSRPLLDPEDIVRLTLEELMAMMAARARAHGDE